MTRLGGMPADKPLRVDAGCLRIRRLALADAPALHAALGDAAVMRFIEPPFTLDETRAFIERAGLCHPPRVYAACLRDTGEVVGHVIFHPFDDSAWEIGWVLRRDCWGRGFATALTHALAGEAARRGIRALVIECAPQNAASRRIAERCGFCLEGQSGGLCVYRRHLTGGTP